MTNLSAQLTRFIGRQQEVAELRQLIRTNRFVTLTGSGGVGKTRLAIEVGATLVEATREVAPFPDGVWLVELAPLLDSAAVPRAVASVFHLPDELHRAPAEITADHLRAQHLLLILDNCEHLIGACAELAEALLRACPHLHILATSREPLRVPGERMWRVPSLSTPDLAHLSSLEQALNYEAIQLFIEHAQAVHPGFRLTPQNVAAVAHICKRLDGIPLAIEMAAARVAALSVAEIAARLEPRLEVLASGARTALSRHQTLRATLDWSYDLLTAPEQVLLARLSVFVGGWTVEAAEAVAANAGVGILPLLLSLVDKSLVIADADAERRDGATRFRMLETVRQYGLSRLEESGETEAIRQRHAAFFVELAERVHPNMNGEERKARYVRLDAEQDNLRAALSWALATGNAELGLRLVGALGEYWYWWARNWNEGWSWISQFLALPLAQHFPHARATALSVAVNLLEYLGESTQATRVAEESLALFRELGDKRGIAWILADKGLGAWNSADYVEAVQFLDESITLFREIGDRRGLTWALAWRAATARDLGQFEAAAGWFDACVTAAKAIDDTIVVANVYHSLGDLAYATGDYERATALQQQAIVLLREGGDPDGANYSLASLACIALIQGDLELAAAQFEASEAWFRQAHQRNGPCWILHHLGYVRHRQGDDHAASALLCEALTVQQQQQRKLLLIQSLERCAWIAADWHQPQRAARLFGAAEIARERIGAPLPPSEHRLYDGHLAQARADLDGSAFDAAWAEGRTMTLEQAIEYGLAGLRNC